jgi:hypothetical protein
MGIALKKYKGFLRLRAAALAAAAASKGIDAILEDADGAHGNPNLDPNITDIAKPHTIINADIDIDSDNVEEMLDEELTVEDVAGKFERMFLRAARSYVQSKALCALADSFISFTDCGKSKILQVTNGIVTDVTKGYSNKADSIVSIREEFIINDSITVSEPLDTYIFGTAERTACANAMDLITFDRMRVLLSELGRVSAAGSAVKIQYAGVRTAPSWILTRSLI